MTNPPPHRMLPRHDPPIPRSAGPVPPPPAAAVMPVDGWPCIGGCVRSSQLTAMGADYVCWSCAYGRQVAAAAAIAAATPPPPYVWVRTPSRRQCAGCGGHLAAMERHLWHEADNTNWHRACVGVVAGEGTP